MGRFFFYAFGYEKAPAIGRDFLKCVRSFDFATCVAPLRMTLD